MKTANRLIAAIIGAVTAVSTFTPAVSAYTDGVHDTDDMIESDIHFYLWSEYAPDYTGYRIYYSEEEDAFYGMADSSDMEIVYVPADGVTVDDIAAAFEEYKKNDLPDEEESVTSYGEKEIVKKLGINEEGGVISTRIETMVPVRLIAKFCQKNAELFKAVEYRNRIWYLLSISEPFKIPDYDTRSAGEYFKEHGLDWDCRSCSIKLNNIGGKGYNYIDGITIDFPEDMTVYERAEAAFSMLDGKKKNTLYPVITAGSKCSWESTDMLKMSTEVITTTCVPGEMTFGWELYSTVKGDANNDFKVNIADAVTVLQYIANNKKYPLSEQSKLNADCDGVPGITGGDAIMIQKMDAGIV